MARSPLRKCAIALIACGTLLACATTLYHTAGAVDDDERSWSFSATAQQMLGERQRQLQRRLAEVGRPPEPGISVTIDTGEEYKGQEGQDKWVDQHIFRGRRGGVFVDLGCYDGVTYSNTWYFERVLNWSGVCVEPNVAAGAIRTRDRLLSSSCARLTRARAWAPRW
eukprot:2378404-Prymnesium_polylepis.1